MMSYMDLGIIISLTIGITLLIMSAIFSLAALIILKEKPGHE